MRCFWTKTKFLPPFAVLLFLLTGTAAFSQTIHSKAATQLNTTAKSPVKALRKYELKDSAQFIARFRMKITGGNNYAELVPQDYTYTTIEQEQISADLKKYLLTRKDNRFVGIESHVPYACLDYCKLVAENNGTLKLREIVTGRLENVTRKPGSSGSRSTYAAHSVLAPGSGKWYKIGVTSSGIFKMDYNFFKSMGINPDTINPQHINIYGNSFGALPELGGNNTSPDDLLKNAIYFSGDGDGVFNTSDFLLFYAKSPVAFAYSNSFRRYLPRQNHYCDTSYYFVNISPSNTPKRVTTMTNGNSPNTTCNTYDEYLLHEFNSKNFIKSGKLWVGEEFDIDVQREFPIVFDNLKTDEKIKFYSTLYAFTSGSVNSSSFNISIPEASVSRNISIVGVEPGDYPNAASFALDTFSCFVNNSRFNPKYTFNKFAADSKGWLDYFVINTRNNLRMSGNSLTFRDIKTVGTGKITQFTLTSSVPNLVIWNITSPSDAFNVGATFSGTSWSFVENTDSLREFVAFNPAVAHIPPFYVKEVANQDLHGLAELPYVIITHPKFYDQAVALSDLHASRGIDNHVVLVEQVYNEFSSGMRDAAAIRNFMKMFYERAAGNPLTEPKYLLLFGDGSYDNKSILGMGQNFIPTFQSAQSLILSESYVSDDYFGLLDNNEPVSNNSSSLMDLGVGRLVAKNEKEAEDMVKKIKSYVSNTFAEDSENCCGNGNTGTMGAWRNKIVLIGDDEDNGFYASDCESLSDKTVLASPALEIQKIYLDATTQTSTPGGERYYEAEQLIKDAVQEGALLVNYIGHGGEVGWAHERVLNVPTIQGWSNSPAFPIFVTATCEFSRFDDPFRTSAGEYVVLNANGGAVSAFTTTRLVFAWDNSILNNEFYENVFTLNAGEPMLLGDVIKVTKNNVAVSHSADTRNFVLLGDPAIQLKLPYNQLEIDSINGISISSFTDTVKALSVITMSGHVEDPLGNPLPAFNGVVRTKVFDKIKQLSTLGQNIGSTIVPFEEWKNLIFKGRATVTNGRFRFSFVVPKDLNQIVGPGRFVGYANDQLIDGHGQTQQFKTGGINLNAPIDNTGPEIQVMLNDDKFVDGGTTNTEPYLVVNLRDENGINTVGTGIGHDITGVLDNETSKTIILNDKYEADKDSYQSGKVKFQLQKLTPGEHTLKVKAFDVYNNSAEKEIRFVVADKEELVLEHVLNYPNPFTTRTEFMFEHNYSCDYMNVQIQVFTISGKLVKTIEHDLSNTGFRVNGIYWDGKDDYGDKLARGTYIYRLKTRTNNITAEKIERLVILY